MGMVFNSLWGVIIGGLAYVDRISFGTKLVNKSPQPMLGCLLRSVAILL
jgi:hypothetical protein